eukprot:4656259-Alexandrium_andersonii.AAC.1
MSASLVGSEMCIRDSVRCWPRVPAGPGVPVGILYPLVVPREALRRVPVSYTHLTLPTICSV